MPLYHYFVILFQNKKNKKIIYSVKTYKKAFDVYKSYVDKPKPEYYKKYIAQKEVDYAIGLLTNKIREKKPVINIKDSLGRNSTPVINSNLTILKLKPLIIEEQIFDYKTKKKIYLDDMINQYVPDNKFIQLFKLNSRIFVQDDDVFNMFITKNLDDCDRAYKALQNKLKKRKNILFSKDISTHQRVLLYDILEKHGFRRTSLWKHYSE